MDGGAEEPVKGARRRATSRGGARAPVARAPIPRRGASLAVVLWALVALGALSAWAALAARVETALSANYRDHAAALALAEAAVAEALAREAAAPGPAGAPRELEGTMETGTWSARWTPAAGRYAVRGAGRSGRAAREVEAWALPGPAGPRVVAWREVLR